MVQPLVEMMGDAYPELRAKQGFIELALKAEENRPEYAAVAKAYEGWEQPYDTDASRALLIERLRAKHGSRPD